MGAMLIFRFFNMHYETNVPTLNSIFMFSIFVFNVLMFTYHSHVYVLIILIFFDNFSDTLMFTYVLVKFLPVIQHPLYYFRLFLFIFFSCILIFQSFIFFCIDVMFLCLYITLMFI